MFGSPAECSAWGGCRHKRASNTAHQSHIDPRRASAAGPADQHGCIRMGADAAACRPRHGVLPVNRHLFSVYVTFWSSRSLTCILVTAFASRGCWLISIASFQLRLAPALKAGAQTWTSPICTRSSALLLQCGKAAGCEMSCWVLKCNSKRTSNRTSAWIVMQVRYPGAVRQAPAQKLELYDYDGNQFARL